MGAAGGRNEVNRILESLHYGSGDNVQPHSIDLSLVRLILRGDDAKHMNFYRMSRETLDKLLALLYGHLKHEDTNMRN
ncbi:hypothetical protein PR048_014590 [Dryococelus australis]|uniref:Uncharacterized protein n=1 Tax=Dryococelus australis TaxID=614101 RepID=A0ABQ9HEL9_9NEOP|nr:hypothetical protein PR048_014590 [Dryococelus australis]